MQRQTLTLRLQEVKRQSQMMINSVKEAFEFEQEQKRIVKEKTESDALIIHAMDKQQHKSKMTFVHNELQMTVFFGNVIHTEYSKEDFMSQSLFVPFSQEDIDLHSDNHPEYPLEQEMEDFLSESDIQDYRPVPQYNDERFESEDLVYRPEIIEHEDHSMALKSLDIPVLVPLPVVPFNSSQIIFFQLSKTLDDKIREVVEQTHTVNKFPLQYYLDLEPFRHVFNYILNRFIMCIPEVDKHEAERIWNILCYTVCCALYYYKHLLRQGNDLVNVTDDHSILKFLQSARIFFVDPINHMRNNQKYVMIDPLLSAIDSIIYSFYTGRCTYIDSHDAHKMFRDYADPINVALFYVFGGCCDKVDIGLNVIRTDKMFFADKGRVSFKPKCTLNLKINKPSAWIVRLINRNLSSFKMTDFGKYTNLSMLQILVLNAYDNGDVINSFDCYRFSSNFPFIPRLSLGGFEFSGKLLSHHGLETDALLKFSTIPQDGYYFSRFHVMWVKYSEEYLKTSMIRNYKLDVDTVQLMTGIFAPESA